MYIRALLALLTFAGFLSAGTVMDQISGWTYTGQNGYSSQFFESGYASFSVAALDNFTTGAGTIDRVEAIMLRWNGTTSFAPIESWSVEVYSAPSFAGTSLTGDIGSELVLPGNVTLTTNYLGGTDRAHVSIPVNIPVAAGSYWIAVIPRMDFTVNGQIGVIGSSVGSPLGADAVQANPGGGFGFGGNYAAISPATDLAYLVDVTPAGVPEPATWTAMIGGIAALAFRRYRASK